MRQAVEGRLSKVRMPRTNTVLQPRTFIFSFVRKARKGRLRPTFPSPYALAGTLLRSKCMELVLRRGSKMLRVKMRNISDKVASSVYISRQHTRKEINEECDERDPCRVCRRNKKTKTASKQSPCHVWECKQEEIAATKSINCLDSVTTGIDQAFIFGRSKDWRQRLTQTAGNANSQLIKP